MQIAKAILLSALVPATSLLAQTTTITENETGTISNSTDAAGLFGPAGASLNGKAIAIHYQYVPAYFGASQTCRNHTCTTNTSQNSPNTPGAVLITVTIDGKQASFSSTSYGSLLFSTQSDDAFRIGANADSYASNGTGCTVTNSFRAPVAFGATLSPSNQPVLNQVNSAVRFFNAAVSVIPVETINFSVSSATK